MKPVLVSQRAANDVSRLEDWLIERNPSAAIKVGRLLREAFSSLAELPERTAVIDAAQHRELVLRFGRGGYVIRYVIRPDAVVVTRVWHSLEDRS